QQQYDLSRIQVRVNLLFPYLSRHYFTIMPARDITLSLQEGEMVFQFLTQRFILTSVGIGVEDFYRHTIVYPSVYYGTFLVSAIRFPLLSGVSNQSRLLG